MRYTLDNPPGKCPPIELGLTPGFGLAIWRVMQRQWMDHQPEPSKNGVLCRDPLCHRRWPCWGFRAASDTLEHLHEYPEGGGLVGYARVPQVLMEREPRLTKMPVPS